MTFQVVRSIDVLDHLGNPLNNINELEYINGEIYANIWQTDWIARIDPVNGAIIAWIDLTGLRTSGEVLNGIAYDATTGHLLVTGKWWPDMAGSTSSQAAQRRGSPRRHLGQRCLRPRRSSSGLQGPVSRGDWLYVGSTHGGSDLQPGPRHEPGSYRRWAAILTGARCTPGCGGCGVADGSSRTHLHGGKRGRIADHPTAEHPTGDHPTGARNCASGRIPGVSMVAGNGRFELLKRMSQLAGAADLYNQDRGASLFGVRFGSSD